MEIDHITYNVGSFSSRHQSEENRRRSLNQLMPLPLSSPSSEEHRGRMAGGNKTAEDHLSCPSCKRQYIEPRVLACLHTFCSSCLLALVEAQQQQADSWSNSDIGLQFDGPPLAQHAAAGSSSGSGSAGSGYESAGSWTLGKTHDVHHIACPTCGVESRLPSGGVAALPLHYVLQRRLLLTTLDRDTTAVLCDLCSTDMPASSRCTNCQLSLCHFCAEAHCRQRVTAGHDVVLLSDTRMRGISARKQLMCSTHPDQELRLFCAPCRALTCRDCCVVLHRGHACDTVARASLSYTSTVREALHKVKPLAEQASLGLDRLNLVSRKIELRCGEVEQEIDRFIESYISALEDHRRTLLQHMQEIRETKLEALRAQQADMQLQANNTHTVVRFTEDLLAEGTEAELLSFVTPVLQQLELSCATATGWMEPRASECLQFLPGENAGVVNSCTLFGVITTQTISPQHCTLNTEGLLNCRQYKKAEAVLIARDADEQPLCHGGEKIGAELRYRDASNRRISVHVADLRNGSYQLTFVPETSGNLSLSVTVRGKPIKGNPFRVGVRTLRAHQGSFHCCSFCSSGGNKEATCGCGGSMPGYRGCGHGHDGHPGRRHWSCCGNLLENSECGGRVNSGVYQFTL